MSFSSEFEETGSEEYDVPDLNCCCYTAHVVFCPCFSCRYSNSVSQDDPYVKNEKTKTETKCKGKQFSIQSPKKGRTPEVFFSPSQT
jgi:hypothetical protein